MALLSQKQASVQTQVGVQAENTAQAAQKAAALSEISAMPLADLQWLAGKIRTNGVATMTKKLATAKNFI